MTERLDPSALRELFLFERLSDDQLAWLAERGEVTAYETGTTIYRVGEPATCLYVLLEGTLSLVMRAPGARSRSTGPTTAAPTPGRSSPTSTCRWRAPTAPACGP